MKLYWLNVLLITLLSLNVSAQDTSTTSVIYEEGSFLNRDKNWELAIPIWIPGFRGNYAYGDVSLEGEDGTDPGVPANPIEPPPPGEPPVGGGNILSRLLNPYSSAAAAFDEVQIRPPKRPVNAFNPAAVFI